MQAVYFTQIWDLYFKKKASALMRMPLEELISSLFDNQLAGCGAFIRLNT